MSSTVFTYTDNTTSTSTDTILSDNSYNTSKFLKSVSIGSMVTSIDNSAFSSQSSLDTVLFTNASSLSNIGNSAFRNTAIATVDLSLAANLTSIGSYSFRNTSLTTITIPDSVTSLGGSVFLECSSLTSVTIGSGLTTIPSNTFKASGLVSIVFPNTVTQINSSVLRECSSLESITIGTNVTSINSNLYTNSPLMATLIFEDVRNLTTVSTTQSGPVDLSVEFKGVTQYSELPAAVKAWFPETGHSYTYTPILESGTCFIGSSIVQTNQGNKPICAVTTNDTIHGQKIIAVTRNISTNDFLVKIKKNALGPNIPRMDTTVSPNHKILFMGQLRPAKELQGPLIEHIKYNGELLYNILLEKHGKMIVNGLIAETLHPENIMALLYSVKCSSELRTSTIKQINESVHNNDYELYSSICNEFFKELSVC